MSHSNPNPDERDQTLATPWALFYEIQSRFGRRGGYTLDACANADNAKVVPYYSLDERGEDALVLPWTGRVWCNPPYNAIGDFIDRAVDQVWGDGSGGPCELATFLVPARTDRAWWQAAQRWGHVHALAGRVQFVWPAHATPERKKQNRNAEPSVIVQIERPIRSASFSAIPEERADRGRVGRMLLALPT